MCRGERKQMVDCGSLIDMERLQWPLSYRRRCRHRRCRPTSCAPSPTRERSNSKPIAFTCRRTDRKSVVEGKSVSVRVDPGGRRIIKKTQNTKIKHLKIYISI